MAISKAHQRVTTGKLQFSIDDQTSMDNLLVTVSQNGNVVGKVKMTWSYWPFPKSFQQGGSLGKILDILLSLVDGMDEEMQSSGYVKPPEK